MSVSGPVLIEAQRLEAQLCAVVRFLVEMAGAQPDPAEMLESALHGKIAFKKLKMKVKGFDLNGLAAKQGKIILRVTSPDPHLQGFLPESACYITDLATHQGFCAHVVSGVGEYRAMLLQNITIPQEADEEEIIGTDAPQGAAAPALQRLPDPEPVASGLTPLPDPEPVAPGIAPLEGS